MPYRGPRDSENKERINLRVAHAASGFVPEDEKRDAWVLALDYPRADGRPRSCQMLVELGGFQPCHAIAVSNDPVAVRKMEQADSGMCIENATIPTKNDETTAELELRCVPGAVLRVIFLDTCTGKFEHVENMLTHLHKYMHPKGCLVVVGSVCRNDGFCHGIDIARLNGKVQRTIAYHVRLQHLFDWQSFQPWLALQMYLTEQAAISSDQMCYACGIYTKEVGIVHDLKHVAFSTTRAIIAQAHANVAGTTRAHPQHERAPPSSLTIAPTRATRATPRVRIQRTPLNVATSHGASYGADVGHLELQRRQRKRKASAPLRRTTRLQASAAAREEEGAKRIRAAPEKMRPARSSANARDDTFDQCPLSARCDREPRHVGRCSKRKQPSAAPSLLCA